MEFDRMYLGNLMTRALAIATSDERSDQSGGVKEECNFLRFRLGQISEREPSVWFELLVASYPHPPKKTFVVLIPISLMQVCV